MPGGLGHLTDSNSIPQNLTTTSHLIQIAIILLMFFLSHVVQVVLQFVLQSHLFLIDEALKFDDSMISLHWICQILMNCLCKLLLFFLTVQEIFVGFSPSPEKLWFCTEKIVSTEWQDLTPRQCTDDCSEIHLLR